MPEGNRVRPTTEKVKEAIFSSLMHYTEDAVVCDLFSGTGNLGLEALSRGAKHCYFFDASRESIGITKSNIKMCRAEDSSTVNVMDFRRALEKLKDDNVKVDMFLCDPPYSNGYYDDIMMLIREYDILNEDGVILLEHNTREPLPEEYFGFTKLKDKEFGNVTFTIYY
ncbi:MAG: 16S rRNA (guanine(966)-N(2))-methyltransferase RsmD [Clostridia bacterium]|nr:16S rRNA (guanine(966)-N(2))-methyltransferase RsmD [Clostridia bacterium]